MPLRRTYRVHLVGIGGAGMSGIAEVLVNLGYQVSGSDLVATEATLRLENLGARVHLGHHPENLGEADVVVVSSAVSGDNPEVVAARARAIPVIQRAEMLAELMRMKHAVAVAGSHGKTTTTSMLGAILAEAGLDPTLVVGGRINSLGSNARLGQGELLVAEADESDGSFLRLTPTFAVVTNVDPEHLDHYGSLTALLDAFVEFANKVPFYGLAVLCLDHPQVRALLPRVHKRVATYGIASQADFRAEGLRFSPGEVAFHVRRRGLVLGELRLRMLGEHNVLNALAAVAVADELRVPFEVTQRALAGFEGVQRRFSLKGSARGVTVVDDYGHHPWRSGPPSRARGAPTRTGWWSCSSRTATRAPRRSRRSSVPPSTTPISSWSWTSTRPASPPSRASAGRGCSRVSGAKGTAARTTSRSAGPPSTGCSSTPGLATT